MYINKQTVELGLPVAKFVNACDRLVIMVREYKRKSTRGSYGKETLDAAIDMIRRGEMSKRKASHIWYST